MVVARTTRLFRPIWPTTDDSWDIRHRIKDPFRRNVVGTMRHRVDCIRVVFEACGGLYIKNIFYPSSAFCRKDVVMRWLDLGTCSGSGRSEDRYSRSFTMLTNVTRFDSSAQNLTYRITHSPDTVKLWRYAEIHLVCVLLKSNERTHIERVSRDWNGVRLYVDWHHVELQEIISSAIMIEITRLIKYLMHRTIVCLGRR